MQEDVTFDPSAAKTVLEALGFGVDEEGFVIDGDGERVEPAGDDEVKIEDFGGVGEGSKVVVKDNYSSVSEYVEEKHGLR